MSSFALSSSKSTANAGSFNQKQKQHQQQQQSQILMELSEIVNTLTSIRQVLCDLERHTNPSNVGSYAQRQELLLQELRQWEHVQKTT
jgi:hypothetical protein